MSDLEKINNVMIKITQKEIDAALDKAYKKAGHNAYFGNGFHAGVMFALELIKEKEDQDKQIV